jgi:dihydroorotate dehydrogenase (fumarate)
MNPDPIFHFNKIPIMNIETTYMGLKLGSPIVVSACTLSDQLENIVRMEDNGAGAIVMYSLFEEHIRKEEIKYKHLIPSNKFAASEAMESLSETAQLSRGPFEYFEKIREAKSRVKIPIIASLNGISSDGWVECAKLLEDAGADGIEMNIFFIPGNMEMSSGEVEQLYLNIIAAIKNEVNIPIAIKLNPYFSALGNMAMRMERAGADALVLFNRFYQPDFNIDELVVKPDLHLSESIEIRLPLSWISLLYGKVNVSLAANSGVQSSTEVIKYLLAGANVVMTASALYKHGIQYLKTLNRGLEDWMSRMGFDSLRTFAGIMSQHRVSNPVAYERANYIKILESKK